MKIEEMIDDLMPHDTSCGEGQVSTSGATDDQVLDLLQRSLPTMKQHFMRHPSNRGLSPEELERAWVAAVPKIRQRFMTDPELRRMAACGPPRIESIQKDQPMKIEEIASRLIKLRESMSSFIQTGTLREELGFDGYGEALRRRWIMADQEGTGMITITNQLGTIKEMRELAEDFCFKCKCKPCKCKNKDGKCEKCKDGECTCKPEPVKCESLTEGNDHECPHCHKICTNGQAICEHCGANRLRKPAREDAHFIAQSHAFRQKPSIQEIATMGLGNRPNNGPAIPATGGHSAPATASAAPSATTAASDGTSRQDVQIGSDVCVVEGGKTFTGKIAQVKADGRYVVSFGGDKPATVRDYDKTEVSPLQAQ